MFSCIHGHFAFLKLLIEGVVVRVTWFSMIVLKDY